MGRRVGLSFGNEDFASSTVLRIGRLTSESARGADDWMGRGESGRSAGGVGKSGAIGFTTGNGATPDATETNWFNGAVLLEVSRCGKCNNGGGGSGRDVGLSLEEGFTTGSAGAAGTASDAGAAGGVGIGCLRGRFGLRDGGVVGGEVGLFAVGMGFGDGCDMGLGAGGSTHAVESQTRTRFSRSSRVHGERIGTRDCGCGRVGEAVVGDLGSRCVERGGDGGMTAGGAGRLVGECIGGVLRDAGLWKGVCR